MNPRLEQLRQRTNPYYGISMLKGDKGDKGDPGINGKDGKDGRDGTDGLPGRDGVDGKDGKNGRNGVDGLPGKDGKDGKNGKDGKDGKDSDIQKVIDAVLKQIADGKALKVEHVDGLTGSLRQLRDHLKLGGFRGGGDTVAAGTNVTITTANGVKTISATGGAATIYTETPSGLIDGSNKTYTTVHAINTVIGLWYNGEFIHPAEYVVAGAGFTMSTALPSISGGALTISYT